MGVHNHNHLVDQLSLSPCSELCELEYSVMNGPGCGWKLEFISSITSLNIQNIIIKSNLELFQGFVDNHRRGFDDILTRLMGLQGRESGLALKVTFKGPWVKSHQIISLPNFDKKGGKVVLIYMRGSRIG